MNTEEFISVQLARWPMAAANHRALEECLTRRIKTSRRTFAVQHNPARAISTGADTAPKAIAARPCFLCAANRPAEQFGLPADGYEILLNPYPIFPGHLTIPATSHTPQLLKGRCGDMLGLCDRLPGHTVFYNGAACGASAPDHQHFQAAPTEYFPIWKAIAGNSPAAERDGVAVYDILPACIVINDATAETMQRVMELLPCPERMPEPMVNVLARKITDGSGRHQVIIIPRRRHRPADFGTGPGQRLISPASVDLAGVIITPRETDFQAITPESLTALIEEVTYPSETLKALI